METESVQVRTLLRHNHNETPARDAAQFRDCDIQTLYVFEGVSAHDRVE